MTPSRVGAQGGDSLQISGMGFQPQMAAQLGGVAASVVDFGANRLVLQTPPLPDGVRDVVVSDPATSGFSTMQGAVTVGAGPTDTIQLLPVQNPAIPVGGETATPLEFLVTATDGTPVAGATVALNSTNGLTLDPCGGATNCSVFSNESGRVVVNVGVTAVGPGVVTAVLAPASYSNPSTASVTLDGVAANLDIALVGQLVEVEQGTTVDVPLLARVLSASGPQPSVPVNFMVVSGQGTLSAASVTTDANGNAADTVHISPVSGTVLVVACIFVANGPCKTFTITAVAASALQIEAVSGTQQVVTEGQLVAPVVMRVTNNSLPPFPVFGANVTFVNVLSRSSSSSTPPVNIDGGGGSNNFDPVLLGSETTSVTSDGDGLAMIAPWPTPVTAGEEVRGLATVDSGAQAGFFLQVLAPVPGAGEARVVVPRAGGAVGRVNPSGAGASWFSGVVGGLFSGVWGWAGDGAANSNIGTNDAVAPSANNAAETSASEPENEPEAKPAAGLAKAGSKATCEQCSGVPCSAAPE